MLVVPWRFSFCRKNEMLTLELQDNEAEAFKTFRKHQDQIEAIIQSGALNVRKGDVIMSLSAEGTITKIDVHMNAYIRRNGTVNLEQSNFAWTP